MPAAACAERSLHTEFIRLSFSGSRSDPAAVTVAAVVIVRETDSTAECLTNLHLPSNKALPHFPIKLMKPDKKRQRNQKAPRLRGITSHEISHSASSILEILKKFIYSEMIDTYVTILKSYADGAVPGSPLKRRFPEYMKIPLFLIAE